MVVIKKHFQNILATFAERIQYESREKNVTTLLRWNLAVLCILGSIVTLKYILELV